MNKISMSYQCQSPVLFLVFNRPDVTAQVFAAIRAAKPTQLYVACDGARADKAGEKQIVETVRHIATNVDWECEVKTLFRESNLGCKQAVNSGITWFFEHVEAGIILEDDTVPELSFFPFCEELLHKYADDSRVGMISGNNHLPEYKLEHASYLFSKFKWIWGWATWRRAWINQDLDLDCLKSPSADSVIRNMGYTAKSVRSWSKKVLSLDTGKVDTWDYQWFLSLSAQNQLSIIPRHNLVANVGFDTAGGTHCSGKAPSRYAETSAMDFPLQHPVCFVPDWKHERLYEHVLVSHGTGLGGYIPNWLMPYIKRIIQIFTKK